MKILIPQLFFFVIYFFVSVKLLLEQKIQQYFRYHKGQTNWFSILFLSSLEAFAKLKLHNFLAYFTIPFLLVIKCNHDVEKTVNSRHRTPPYFGFSQIGLEPIVAEIQHNIIKILNLLSFFYVLTYITLKYKCHSSPSIYSCLFI